MKPADILPPEKAQDVLRILAASDPDFAAFSTEVRNAMENNQTLPADLVADTLAILQQDPHLSSGIKALVNSSIEKKSFTTGSEVMVCVAVAFLLRTHLKVKRGPTGKWEFLIEHKPGDSKFFTIVLEKLQAWLGREQ